MAELNEPVIHRKKKKVIVVNERKSSIVSATITKIVKPEKVKPPKAAKLKKVKQPPPPPKVKGPAPALHPDGTPQERAEKFLARLKSEQALFQQYQPLKLKVNKDLNKMYPDTARHIICRSLERYCNTLEYLQTLKANADRFDLDLNPVGQVTEDQALEAKTRWKTNLRATIKRR